MMSACRTGTLILTLLAAVEAAPALCPSGLRVETTDTSIHLAFETDTPGRQTRVRLQYGKTPRLRRTGAADRANHPTATRRFLNATDLLPGLEKLYFDPQVSAKNGQSWSSYSSCQAQLCPGPGEQPGGYFCEADGAERLIPFVSLPPDDGKVEAPKLPRHARADPRKRPAIDGKITQLTDCTGVQQALNDHSTGGSKDPNLNHEIRLPPGQICRPELEDSAAGKNLANYVLPEKKGDGVTIITCGWEPGLGPPPGVQYTPKLRNGRACGFGLNRRTVRQGSAFEGNGALFLSPKTCGAPPCTQGWRFETLVIEAGDWRNFSPRKVSVKSVDAATGRIALAEPIDDLYATNSEAIHHLPGIRTMVQSRGRKRHADYNERGCLTIKRSSNELQCYGADRMTGEYQGGGYVSAAQAYEIESCASVDGNTTCALEAEHGLGDFHSFRIAKISGGQLEIDAEAHGWNDKATVLIEGNSECDGIYTIDSVTGPHAAKLASTWCNGSGGVVRRLYMGRFFDLEGPAAEALEGAHLVDFPAPDKVRAFNVDLDGAQLETGGFVYTNPKIGAFFRLPLASNLTWDRILFDIGAPFRVFNVFSFKSNEDGSLACDCAILDSYVDGLHFWQPVSPGAGVVESAQTYRPFSAVPAFVRANSVKDLHLDGITFRNTSAFGYFADQFGPIGAQDLTLRRLTIDVPDHLVAGPRSKGLAYNLRHFIELKGGDRVLMEGLDMRNWPAVAVAPSAPILLSYRATEVKPRPRFMRDITMRNLFMRSVAAGIAVSDQGTDAYSPQEPIRRTLIDNWLLDGIDYPNRQSAPHGQALEAPGTFYEVLPAGGFALLAGGPMEDLKVSRVTARRLRSKHFPNFLTFLGDRVNGVQIDRSIISYSPTRGQQAGIGPYVNATRNLFPPITEGGAKGFNQWSTRMGEPDPHTWFGTPAAPVGVIPCMTDSSLIRMDLNGKNNTKSAAELAFACSGENCDRWNVIIAGKDRQSCAEREALVLDQDLNGIGPFEGLGADTKELSKALGYFPSKITEVTGSGAKLIYRPLSGEPCTVDHGRDPDFQKYIRGQDTGGEGTRGMQLAGYAPGETAYYRLLCPKAVQVWGKFETAKQ